MIRIFDEKLLILNWWIYSIVRSIGRLHIPFTYIYVIGCIFWNIFGSNFFFRVCNCMLLSDWRILYQYQIQNEFFWNHTSENFHILEKMYLYVYLIFTHIHNLDEIMYIDKHKNISLINQRADFHSNSKGAKFKLTSLFIIHLVHSVKLNEFGKVFISIFFFLPLAELN